MLENINCGHGTVSEGNGPRQWKRLKRTTKKQMVELCATDVNKCTITNWKEGSKNRADWEKCIKGGGKSALDCSAIEDGGGGEEEEEEGGGE